MSFSCRLPVILGFFIGSDQKLMAGALGGFVSAG
jgi:hypothetical protein